MEFIGEKLYSCFDYRELVREFCNGKGGKVVTYRDLAREIGMRSPDYLAMILDGKRNLSSKYALPLARSLKLRGRDREYFLALVAYNQAKAPEEKALLWEKILGFAPLRTHLLSKDSIGLFTHWYILALYELISLTGFRDEPKWISARFGRLISAKEAESGFAALCEAGLVEKQGERWVRARGDLFIGGIPSETIRNYHAKMLDVAKIALFERGIDERILSNTVLAIPGAAYPQFAARLEEFQKDIMRMASKYASGDTREDACESNLPDMIYQFSMQLYPLTVKEPES